MEYKESVMDRLGQTFELYKNNFVKLTLPVFLYNLLSVVFIIGIVISIVWLFLGNTPPNIGLLIFLGILFLIVFLAYFIFYIPVFNCSIKSIKDAANWEKIDLKANFSYAMKHFWWMVMVYWYVFLYVMLIPVAILLVWLILIALGSYWIWSFILMIWSLVYLWFAIYRWLKSMFSVYNAIDKNNYSKENFYEYMKITDSKLWRIIGNFLVYALVVWVIMLIVWIILGVIWLWTSSITEWLKDFQNIDKFIQNYSFFGSLIGNILNTAVSAIATVFGFVFIYIFYKRLDSEYTGKQENKVEIKTKEL